METIQLNDTQFKYKERGSGQPVIFVHGSACDYRIWNNQIEPFSKQYCVIAYSRRYHHPNKWSGDGSDYTVSLHSRDLTALIKALSSYPVHLVGSSYGAYISLYVAMENPELVKSLVLGEPPVIPLLLTNPDNLLQLLSLFINDFSAAKSFMRFGMKAWKPAQSAFDRGALKEGTRLFNNGVLGEGGFEKLPEDQKTAVLDNAKALKAELLGPGFPEFPKEDAAKIHAPTLFIYGKQSPKFFHSISDRLTTLLPNTEQAYIPNASHDTQGDNPAAYNAKVLDFLARHN